MTLASATAQSMRMSIRHNAIVLSEIPSFLCPVLSQIRYNVLTRSIHSSPRRTSHSNRSFLELESYGSISPVSTANTTRLPLQCTGCGALSQSTNKHEAGYYSLNRRHVRAFMGQLDEKSSRRESDAEIVREALKKAGADIAETLHVNSVDRPVTSYAEPPVCDRCHKLLHHQSGTSIQHPTIDSLQETVFESPYKYNHIYHIIDAADFPMSLIPRIHKLLQITPQRSMNRRSKSGRFYHGRKTELSFIITRSDLLAPLKTQVDSLMPYLTAVLRDALGKSGQDVRLGNVRCVSSKRGWWTRELKEDIWDRGGGGWMVGKVNVGKSQLFESVFPKGRREAGRLASWEIRPSPQVSHTSDSESSADLSSDSLDTSSLLPPAQPETDYPTMPIVSPLPGTTASPIRVPFGNGKGELIDLPGLSRGDLELYVQEEHRRSLVMRSRVTPEQQVIKPGQSLLIGGLVRITPKTPDLVFLSYAFTPIAAHLTSTEKAIGIQLHERESVVENIALPEIASKIASAGTFHLKWDVTKSRSGPITAKDAAAIKVDRLPYRVLSTDILIEGCGWIELVAQVRKKDLNLEPSSKIDEEYAFGDTAFDEPEQVPKWPEVEVFSPEGRFIAARRPMGAWLISEEHKPDRKFKGRPRQSKVGDKKRTKVAERTSRPQIV